MENLDLLIEKFKEAKDELQKAEALKPRIKTPTVDIPYVERFKTPAVPVAKAEDDKDSRWAKKMKNFNKAEEIEKALPPGAKVHMLHDASRAAVAAAPKVAVKPGGVADRGPVQAKKDLNWLTGASTHGSAPDVPAGAGRDIPGFEKEEISCGKNGQWKLDKGVNTVGGGGVIDDGV